MPVGPLNPVKGVARIAWAAVQIQVYPSKLSTCGDYGCFKSQWPCTEIVADHSPSETTPASVPVTTMRARICGRSELCIRLHLCGLMRSML